MTERIRPKFKPKHQFAAEVKNAALTALYAQVSDLKRELESERALHWHFRERWEQTAEAKALKLTDAKEEAA